MGTATAQTGNVVLDPVGALVVVAKPSWARLGGVAAFCLCLIWLSVGITSNFTISRPDVVLRLWPWSVQAKAAMANEILTTAHQSPAAIAQSRDLARAALRRDPTNVAAARALGLAAGLTNQISDATRWFAYSERLSRRDFATQYLLIEQEVTRGNIGGALVHYDRALRTSTVSEPILIPILRSSANDPAIAAPMGDLLARRPNWRLPFLVDVAGSLTNAQAIVALIIHARLDMSDQQDREIVEQGLRRLLALRQIAATRALHDHYRPTAARVGLINDPQFGDSGELAPFKWALGDEDNLGAERDFDDQGRPFLALRSASERQGVVASQQLLLDPGSYRLSGTAADTGNAATETPMLQVSCGDVGRTWSRPMPVAGDNPVGFAFDLVVPAGCHRQIIEVRVSAAQDTHARLFMVKIDRR